MSKFNQKEGVFNAVCQVLGQQSFDSAVELSKEQRAEVISMVSEGFQQETIDMSDSARAKYDTEAKLRSYTSGLVSNWLSKDKRLNGGVKHTIQNPGSRAGSGDPVIKNLKLFKSTLTDQAHIDAVQAEIDARIAELKQNRTKKVDINMDLIPEDLKDLVNS